MASNVKGAAKKVANKVKDEAEDAWNVGFRGWLRRNPLNGFWSGVALGAGAVIAIVIFFG